MPRKRKIKRINTQAIAQDIINAIFPPRMTREQEDQFHEQEFINYLHEKGDHDQAALMAEIFVERFGFAPDVPPADTPAKNDRLCN